MPKNIAPAVYHPSAANAFLSESKNGYDADDLEMKVKVVVRGEILVLYFNCENMLLEQFWREIREACHFADNQQFTVKWLDEEGDPCTISSQRELDEAFRLYKLNKDSELFLHVFPNVPPLPGLPCQGEDKHVYRRGARRWKKFYRVNGHLFQAKRFNKRAACAICRDRVWGLGRQGFHCITCKLSVHKRCHKLVKFPCGQQPPLQHHASSPSWKPVTLASPLSSHPSLMNGPNSMGYDNQAMGAGDGESPFYFDFPKARGSGVSPSGVAQNNCQPEFQANSEETAVPAARSKTVTLDDFNLLKVIGRGSYAKVLQVEHKKTKQVYAMKVIKKTIVTDEEDIDWVQTEKHVFEVASNHPFLVGLHSCFQTTSRLFFVIEFVPGGDLMFHMQRQRRLHEEHARFYSAEIILALHFLHSCKIIYRDLKLDNVLIDADGHIKLTDYGMCKEGIGPQDKTSTFCGTPNYIAPEILRGEDYSFSVDWWALGVLMYEMLAGRSPFDIVGMSDAPDQQTEDLLFQVILERTIRIPRSLSVKAASILKGFLNKNAKERLGCCQNDHGVQDLERGFDDIRTHAFFKTVQWDLLVQRQVPPPYRPAIKDERDLENFDKQFTDEPVQFTPDDQTKISAIDQTEFEGFEYVNPFLMTQNDAV